MPAQWPLKSRRGRTTPIANLHENDVWQRTFMLLGLEPLTPFATASSADERKMSNHEIGAATEPPVLPSTPLAVHTEATAKITFFDLPQETQKQIVSHVSPSDLIALSLVCHKLRHLAASQLYRNFHIVFPDEDDPSYESPIDGLAGGLDTFVTSDYNYARFLKEIVLDTLSGGDKGEHAYRHYLYDVSCGKFMNTLFLLTLRKAKALEKFSWNLCVEISRPVFKALHEIPSLQHLHLRMQAGPSLYEKPPPLPSLQEDPTADSVSPSVPSSLFSPSSLSVHNTGVYNMAKSASKYKNKSKEKEPAVAKSAPPTFSGFNNLKTLSILAMDNLDYVDEINVCVRNSSSTLNKLKLSFSESLARKARKPPPVEDTDDSDQEIDEFGNIILPLPPPLASSSDDNSNPTKALRAEEEKKIQEAVIGRILGVDSSTSGQGLNGAEEEDEEEKPSKEADEEDAGKAFIADLRAVAKRLMKSSSSGTSAVRKETLEIIERAARKYVEASKLEQASTEKTKSKLTEDKSSDSSKITNAASSSVVATDGENTVAGNKSDVPEEKSQGMFDKDDKERKPLINTARPLNPDDIDIEQPEFEGDPQDFEEVSATDVQSIEKSIDEVDQTTAELKSLSLHENDGSSVAAPDQASKLERSGPELEDWNSAYENLKSQIEVVLTETLSKANSLEIGKDQASTNKLNLFQRNISQLCDLSEITQSLLRTFKYQVDTRVATDGHMSRHLNKVMSEYVRSTRGLQLRSLSIYLIPIKPSVLSKALDLSVLTRVTLLNVGLQTPFWNMLAKVNKESPLPLSKIYTDNVTSLFLTFASQLDKLVELFLLERSSKVREYSFAPKTTVTIEQIRKVVLKKHLSTLKKLMIKNENDYTWDGDEQTIKLICKRGRALEELALCFGVRSVHTFNQYLPGLIELRAMHIITFRADDTCHWVIREIRKFAVDSVSHNPRMKLEYIAVENTVERLVRRAKKTKRDKGKGKKSTKNQSPSHGIPNLATILNSSDSSESSSSGDDGNDDLRPGLKLETLEGVRFYDIIGIRIFRKDVMAGKL